MFVLGKSYKIRRKLRETIEMSATSEIKTKIRNNIEKLPFRISNFT
jgi:hypothetical protein